MSRNPVALLEYEASRCPELAALIAKIDSMTEGEIGKFPVKLPWMRKALLMLKREHTSDQLAASLGQWVTDGHLPDPIGEMRRWEGSDTFVRIGRTQLEIHYGQLVWFDASGVWIDTIRCQTVDPVLVRQTVSCGPARRSEYMEAVRAKARQLCPTSVTPEPLERIRFYRPA